MLECYGMFRELITHDRIAEEKGSMLQSINQQLEQVLEKITHVDSGLQVLCKHLNKADPN